MMKKIGRRCIQCGQNKAKDHFRNNMKICKTCDFQIQRDRKFKEQSEQEPIPDKVKRFIPHPLHKNWEFDDRTSFKELAQTGPDVTIYQGIELPALPKRNRRNQLMAINSEQIQYAWARQPFYPFSRSMTAEIPVFIVETETEEEDEEESPCI